MKISTWPYFNQKDISDVSEILRSGKVNYWTGEQTKLFETEFSSFFHIKHSIALANGSLALSACYKSLSIKSGDEVITTPRTFIATASSAVLLGLIPVFADIDSQSGCITTETIEPLITNKTKAISVVHIGGWPANMIEICKLAKVYGLYVIEDCAQAHGARIDGKSVGSFGDISAWSFCQDKIISTAGEGGMISTSKIDIWDKIWSLKDHGKSYQECLKKTSNTGFKWLHNSFGSNYRMTEFQSAIGRNQLKRLSKWHSIRKRNATLLTTKLSNLSLLRIPLVPEGIDHAWYKFTAYIVLNQLSSGWTRERIISEITKLGYPAFSGSCGEIYLEKCFKDANLGPKERLPIAKELGETSITFLVHPTISIEQMEDYSNCIIKVIKKASK